MCLPLYALKEKEELAWKDFNSGYAYALKKKKILLIDVYTDWCGWCKVMDRETYAKKEIYDAINADFVAVKFNPEKRDVMYTYKDSTYNGMQLMAIIGQNRINGYPATLFINPVTNQTALHMGYINPQQFNQILAEVKKTLKN